MARNIQLHVLRGTFANMPILTDGELYLCTDTFELYIGSSGNKRMGVSRILGIGNKASVNVVVPKQGTGSGPVNSATIVQFAQINIAGTVYWVPLMQ